MPKKCCLYEKGDKEKCIPTIDDECPDLLGWTFIGSWRVEDDDACYEEPRLPIPIDDLTRWPLDWPKRSPPTPVIIVDATLRDKLRKYLEAYQAEEVIRILESGGIILGPLPKPKPPPKSTK